MKKYLLLLIAAGLLFNSCEEEPEKPSRFITISVPSDFEKNGEEWWVFISDNDGTFLDIEEVQNNGNFTLEIPGNVTSSRVMVSLFFYFPGTYFTTRRIQTYTEILPGDYEMKAALREERLVADAELTFINASPEVQLSLRGDIVQFSKSGNVFDCDIILNENMKADLIATAMNTATGELRYNFLSVSPHTQG